MSAPCEVSVVIATRDRVDLLRRQLDALARQTFPSERFEVVVADDGSSDATPELLAAERGDGLNLRTVRLDRSRGPATARNAGWRVARAPLVAFTDDDCVVEPDWLERGHAAWGGGEWRFVQGSTTPVEEELPNLWPFGYTVEVTAMNGQFETCNIFYPRALLERVGGLDEAFPGAQGEDMDLARRARALGAQPVFAPQARVRHSVFDVGPRAHLRRAWRWWHVTRVLAQHPELRRTRLYHGVFWDWHHYLLVRAILALPFVRRRWGWPLAWWLAGGFVTEELARARKSGSLLLLPYWVLHDVIGAVAIAIGAIRHRTLAI